MIDRIKAYGEALFSLAEEEKQIHEYIAALENVADIFRENPLYTELLSCPSIAVSERLSMLDTALSGNFPEHIISFLMLLCERGELNLINNCIRHFLALVNADRIEFTVTSAVQLTDDEQLRLAQVLANKYGKQVILTCKTDNKILGGLIIKSDGIIIDGSLRKSLHEMKRVIEK